jgi:C4-dicarboxylate transporter, DctM subunit
MSFGEGALIMSILALGLLFIAVTLLIMFSGMPIAFSLGTVALIFMFFFMPASSLDTITQNVYEEMASITLLSIPLFIMKGAAIGRSRAGQDLYGALHVWLGKVPGGLGVANVLACALFAAMAGSSPATCSAIGSAGIPEMRKRGYSPGFAAGVIAAGGTLGILLPPSITMILYSVAAEQSLGRLFLAGIGPGILLVVLFSFYTVWQFHREYKHALATFKQGTPEPEILKRETYTMQQKMNSLPRVLPFLVLLIGVMVALYGGFATPSETAGLGAVLAFVLVAGIYKMWRIRDLSPLLEATIKESTMLMFIIGMSLLFSNVMSHLHLSQSAAQWIVDLELGRWALLTAILFLVIILGFFLPPVSIILMTAPIVLPPLRAANFDLVWFGIVMTIVMETGLIHPPVGLNIFVIKNIAPDIPLNKIIWGVLPFVIIMLLSVVLLCLFPEIATGLANFVMGPVLAR